MAYTTKLTEKLFYKKFTHRLKIDWPAATWTKANQREVDQLLTKTGIEYKHRWAGNVYWDIKLKRYVYTTGMFYYFNDPTLIETFEENFTVQELCKPLNQEHVNAMFDDTKIRIRDKLFYNRFRWAIRFHWNLYGESKKEAIDTIRHWLTVQNRIDKKDYLISPHSSFIVYSNIKTDVAAIRLMFTEINVIDEIKLAKELTEEEK